MDGERDARACVVDAQRQRPPSHAFNFGEASCSELAYFGWVGHTGHTGPPRWIQAPNPGTDLPPTTQNTRPSSAGNRCAGERGRVDAGWLRSWASFRHPSPNNAFSMKDGPPHRSCAVRPIDGGSVHGSQTIPESTWRPTRSYVDTLLIVQGVERHRAVVAQGQPTSQPD